MATVKVKGIILSENNMGDYDKMLTILTPNFGKISCSAKGARRPKSALLAGTQLFCFGEYLLYQGTSTYHMNSCEIIEMFYKIRTDLDKLKYAIHVNKIVQEVTEENENCYNILQLYLNTLYMLSETEKDKEFIVSIFKLRLLTILGFMPRIIACVSCKEKQQLSYFSIRDNGFKCEPCSKQDKSSLYMSESTKNAIKYTISAPAKKVFSFDLKNEVLEEFKLITRIYFDEKMEREYKVEDII